MARWNWEVSKHVCLYSSCAHLVGHLHGPGDHGKFLGKVLVLLFSLGTMIEGLKMLHVSLLSVALLGAAVPGKMN